MTHHDVFLRFQWADRHGLIWTVAFTEEPWGFSGFMASSQVHGTGLVEVQTRDIHSQEHSMARLCNVWVCSKMENRGLGSMLVGKVIEECSRREHKGIDGYLSDVDSDHFTKLRYFYEKLGFSFVFYDVKHPDYRYDRVGKIEMLFNDVGAGSRVNGS